jgi:enamine deaminase RidA (YjgF/YER057c/UK114 family)
MTAHTIVNPDALSEPRGFAHAVVAAPGRTVYLGGQTAHDRDGVVRGGSMVEQFDAAAANVIVALEACGARAEHLVSLQLFVTDAAEYRASLADLGRIYRRHFGRHYPAMALYEIAALFDPAARIEIQGIAVIPAEARP